MIQLLEKDTSNYKTAQEKIKNFFKEMDED